MGASEFAAYAWPAAVSGPAALSVRAGLYYRRASQQFATHHRGALATRGQKREWRRWMAAPCSWQVDWHRTLGALERPDADRQESARRWAELMIHLGNHGFEAPFDFSSPRPVALQYRHGVLRRVRQVRSVRRAGQMEIDVLFDDGSRVRDLAHARSTPHYRPYMRWRRLTLPCFTVADFAALDGAPDTTVQSDGDDVIEADWVWSLARAAQLLDGHARMYARWVRRVVRQIVALPPIDGCTRSSSDTHAPGVVCLSLTHDAATVGELLVHEASHAYFQLLEQVGPVDDGSDERLYYSPFKGRPRPIRVILLTYHAFANVVLYYRTLLQTDAPVDRRAIRETIRDTTAKLRVLQEALDSTPALTKSGRVVYGALREQLTAARGAASQART